MKMNGGVKKEDLGKENVEAVKKGCANLGRHIENIRQFGVPVVVAINHFYSDTDAEIQAIKDYVAAMGAEAILCTHWAEGSAGIEELANKVVALAEAGASQFAPLYPDEMPLFEKINTIVQRIYRGSRSDRRQVGARPAHAWEAGRLWPSAGLHGQDAVFLLDRSRTCAARRPATPCRCARSAVGGRRLRGRHLRRDHDHARPAEGAILGKDFPQRAGQIEGLF